MSAPNDVPEVPVARDTDADDQDLLTVGEAAARLSEEVAAERERVRDLEARAARGEDVSDALARDRRRLEQLTAAWQRSIGAGSRRGGFFDYGSGGSGSADGGSGDGGSGAIPSS